MAIVLISWICISLVLCLAFLGAAARPAPRIDDEMLVSTDADEQRDVAFEGTVPSSYQTA